MSVETMTVYSLGMFYTGVGHAPHPAGTAFTLPKPQAEAWIKDGVASASPPIQSPAVSNQSSEPAASPVVEVASASPPIQSPAISNQSSEPAASPAAEHETPASH